MSTPLEFRATYTLTASTDHHHCNFSFNLPSATYTVIAEFAYDTDWWVTNKAIGSCIVHVGTTDGSNQPFNIHIYWDSQTFNS